MYGSIMVGFQVPPPPPLPPPNDSATADGEAVYTEPNAGGNYTEPYRAMRYSPYYGYGPVLSEIEDSLMRQHGGERELILSLR